ncbi:MAG: alkaline phosphatase [Xanthomonadales bacterium]|nr:alkaline phosphatase [Xanthomonadales bacterium]
MTTRTLLLLLAVGLPLLVGCVSTAPPASTVVQVSDPWFTRGQATLERRKALARPATKAKNVILFIGDGMGISTLTAARIFAAQRDLDGELTGRSGEENHLSFERFPYSALVKTYTTNGQVSDSAGTATAMASGVKTRSGVLSVTSEQPKGVCAGSRDRAVDTILDLAEESGMSTGVVTTTTLTHATPGAFYASTPHRDWEYDAVIPADQKPCPDIARQLIEYDRGDGLEVAMGGGRPYFLPAGRPDPEYSDRTGLRQDGRDLVDEWQQRPGAAYVWNQDQLRDLDVAQTDRLLGLFESWELKYTVFRDPKNEADPTLTEMTRAAIDILQKNPRGFFLMVEGGRIDHGHHYGSAHMALEETRQLSMAVAAAMEKVDLDNTLILVTADHSHTLTISGYPSRGNDILGLVRENDDQGGATGKLARAEDGKPFTTLGYANGPGARHSFDEQGRTDPSDHQTHGSRYRQQALVRLSDETHGGEDVALYATGPQAHLVGGLIEQNVIFHLMRHALGLD